MVQGSEAFSKFSSWRELSQCERRELCLSVIGYFDSHPHDLDAICSSAVGLANSGDRWRWPPEIGPCADTPSTGGLGSLTTLLCPYILASCGCYVPKLSVPGSVAGAIDVLALLAGFQTELDQSQMHRALRTSRIAHSENTSRLAPADAFLFKVRSKLGKKSIPELVIASLLAKKLAVGCNISVVDVRCGPLGNLGTDGETCVRYARLFVSAAMRLGIRCACVITDLSIPRLPFLGRSESLVAMCAVLASKAACEADPWLSEHVDTCIAIAAEALVVANLYPGLEEASIAARDAMASGRAREVFALHLEAQGAEIACLHRLIEAYENCSKVYIESRVSGYLTSIDVRALGAALQRVNGAVFGSNDRIGMRLLKRPHEDVEADERLAMVRFDDSIAADTLGTFLRESASAFLITELPPPTVRREVLAVVHCPDQEFYSA